MTFPSVSATGKASLRSAADSEELGHGVQLSLKLVTVARRRARVTVRLGPGFRVAKWYSDDDPGFQLEVASGPVNLNLKDPMIRV